MPDSDRDSVEAVDAHWAVRAIAPRDRTRAFVAAEELWHALASPAGEARRSSADARERADSLALIAQVASAYEHATLDRAAALAVDPDDATAAARLRDEMELAARRALALERALPFPTPVDPFGAYRIFKIAGVATVAGAPQQLDPWLAVQQEHGTLRPGASHRPAELVPGAELRWDIELRWQLVDIWLALLHLPPKVEHAFDALGALRERRDARDQAFLASLPLAGMQAMRLHLFALYSVADAAAMLTLHCRRGPFSDTGERLARIFGRARDAAAGDLALDDAIQWLALAAAQVADQQTSQIELPGMVG